MVSKEVQEERRAWVNKEFARKTAGTSMSNAKKKRTLKSLWRQAKRQIN